MVKPGHSKGCGTCRRRKVKCDERQPRCLRCERARVACEGFAKDFRWVDQGPSLARSGSHQSDAATPKRSPETDEDNLIKRFNQRLQRHLSPHSSDLYITFTVKKLFEGEPQRQEYSWHSWIKNTLNAKSSSVAYVAFQCLAAACFGHMHHRSPEVMAKAAKLYGRSLIQLRESIEDPITCFDHHNISATIALHLYETIAYTSGRGWIQHAGGAGRLIEMRGPERHQDWPDHGYFTLVRPRVVYQSIISRKRCFLEREEWKTVPWAKHPETKTPHQQLLDIGAHISGLQEGWIKAKSIAEDKDDLLNICRRFVPKVSGLLEEIFRWRWKWEAEHPDACWEIPSDPSQSWTVDPDTGKPLFPTVLSFKDMNNTDEINLYNTTLILLLHCLRICAGNRNLDIIAQQAVQKSLPNGDLPPKTNPLAFPTEYKDYSTIADEIARTVDFCFEEQRRNQGSFSLMIPLRMCALAYSFYSVVPKLRWTIATAKLCADSSAFELSRHMTRPTRLGTTKDIDGFGDVISPDVREIWEAELRDVVSENASVVDGRSSSSEDSSKVSGSQSSKGKGRES